MTNTIGFVVRSFVMQFSMLRAQPRIDGLGVRLQQEWLGTSGEENWLEVAASMGLSLLRHGAL